MRRHGKTLEKVFRTLGTSGDACGRTRASARARGGDGRSTTTTDHATIRRFVEERGGRPARVRGTGDAENAGLLRIDFPGRGKAQELEPISWDEFFEKFEQEKLAFVYQERTRAGRESRFSKLVAR
jgi:hypothetical protein